MESLDLRALELLTGKERANALDVLRELLQQGDVRAVHAVERLVLEELFGDLRSLVESLLKGGLHFPEIGVAAMIALWRLDETFVQNPVTVNHLELMDRNTKLRLADIRAESQESWEEILMFLLRDDE